MRILLQIEWNRKHISCSGIEIIQRHLNNTNSEVIQFGSEVTQKSLRMRNTSRRNAIRPQGYAIYVRSYTIFYRLTIITHKFYKPNIIFSNWITTGHVFSKKI